MLKNYRRPERLQAGLLHEVDLLRSSPVQATWPTTTRPLHPLATAGAERCFAPQGLAQHHRYRIQIRSSDTGRTWTRHQGAARRNWDNRRPGNLFGTSYLSGGKRHTLDSLFIVRWFANTAADHPRRSVPCVDGTPLARTFWSVSQSWSVAPMCPAFLLGANTDRLHAIRKISSRSKARARGALGQLGFADLGGRPLIA